MALDLDALLAEADAIIAGMEAELVPVTLSGRQSGVRFVPVSGAEWRELCLRNAPRVDVRQDMNLGYNVDAVVENYPHIALVMGDEVVDLERVLDAEGKNVSKWPAVWKRLTATGQKDVSAAIWAAHELTPEKLVSEAGKASAGARKKKRS